MSPRLSQHQACPAHHVGLLLPFVHSVASSGTPLCVGTMDSVMHRHTRSWLLYPRGPRSGLGSSVPVHPRLFDLIRPTRRRIPISPHRGSYGCLRCAGAAPRRPTTGSVLSLRVPYRHAALYDPGESIGCLCSVLRQRHWPSSSLNPTRRSQLPHHPLPMGESFRGFPGSLFATACRFAGLPGGSDRALPQPTETFTPELSTGRSPFPLSGIPTVVTEQAPPAGLAPTGTSTSIAALSVDSKQFSMGQSRVRARVIPLSKGLQTRSRFALPLKIEKRQRAAALQEIPHPYLTSTVSQEV